MAGAGSGPFDPVEAESVRNAASRAATIAQVVGALWGITGVVVAGVLFWSAWSDSFSLWGAEYADRWDWWRGAWVLAVGLFAWALLHGLGVALRWLSWRADEAVPYEKFKDSDVWTPRGDEK